MPDAGPRSFGPSVSSSTEMTLHSSNFNARDVGAPSHEVAVPISGATRLFAIIGDPVAQVRSPEMFNAFFFARGIAAAMFPIHVTATDLRDVLSALKRIRNLDGIIVTIPHKLAAVELVDRLLPNANLVGAVNVLGRKSDGAWAGEMFDGLGFVAALRAEGCDPAGLRVAIVGAGGVGRAIAFALAGTGIRNLTICDVDPSRAESLRQGISAHFPGVSVAVTSSMASGVDLAVNATPLGMRSDDPLPFSVAGLTPNAWIADAIMKPEWTPLLTAAQTRGNRVLPGRRMLEHQLAPVAAFWGLADEQRVPSPNFSPLPGP